MAPTELLAEQHANQLPQLVRTAGHRSRLAGGQTERQKPVRAQQEAIASGEVQMIVGTYAIFQEQVQFNGRRW